MDNKITMKEIVDHLANLQGFFCSLYAFDIIKKSNPIYPMLDEVVKKNKKFYDQLVDEMNFYKHPNYHMNNRYIHKRYGGAVMNTKKNNKKNNCIHQVCEYGFYFCKIIRDRQKIINEKNDDVKYGGVIEWLDDSCVKTRKCGYEVKRWI